MGIVVVKPPVQVPTYCQSLLVQNPQESSEGPSDVLGVDNSPPGHEVGVAEILRIEKGQYHLLLPHGVALSLDWPRLAFFKASVVQARGCSTVITDRILQHENSSIIRT
jgi:hypothetical protein